ncbi:MAG TPA: serine hydrolase domain-containing protein [Mycobacteriales bacterium]|jgi:CubicO group peptidase (beta-lactamase class C family)|nr:serine hydrolase domain-containing protein [Mycobacteriales bacterium]
MSAFTATGIERLHRVLARHVDSGEIPGLVALVDRGGDTAVVLAGETGIDGPPVARDTIVRIASMTKPIVAVAALTLVEECVLRLDRPVDDLLPELADRQVLKALDGPLDETVPAERPLTLRDLLTFTMGFGMLGVDPADYPILAAANERELGIGAPDPARTPAPDEWMRRLGELPLMWQPGERWAYNLSADVLGVLVARAAGMSLGDYLAERVFGPVGMPDTGFFVPKEKLDRFATAYTPDLETRTLSVYDPVDGAWSTQPAFESGAGGLVSTADDMRAFGRMLLSGGDGVLSRASIAAMTTDQLTPAQREVVAWVPFEGTSWGFGLGIATQRRGPDSNPGRFGWDGGLGTSWSCDPGEDLVGVLLTQVQWADPAGPTVAADFWTGAYAALT